MKDLLSLNIFIYKDSEEKLLKFYKTNHAPIIFFLDAENNIVYAHAEEDLTADQVSELNSQINNKTITANTTLYFDKTGFLP